MLEYKFSRIGKFQVRAALAVIHDSGVCDHTADGVARDKQDQAVDGVYKEKQISYDQLQYRRGAIGCSVYPGGRTRTSRTWRSPVRSNDAMRLF